MTELAPRLLLISPVHNEAAHIDQVAASVAAQTRPPDTWIVVDDGSTDGTAEAIAAWTDRLAFLTVVRRPQEPAAHQRDRLAAGGPDRAWNHGLAQVDWREFTHLGKLDGDIVLAPEYLEGMLGKFAQDPNLGMAGGILLEPHGDQWKELKTPEEQVTAPARIYSRACFEAIGGMPPRMGADVITTTYARMYGFRTRTFSDLPVRHLRLMGTAQGVLQGRARHGAYQYVVGYPLWWIALRSAMVGLRHHPRLIGGVWFLGGYVRAMLTGTERVSDPAFRAFVRADLRARVRRLYSSGRQRLRKGSQADPASG